MLAQASVRILTFFVFAIILFLVAIVCGENLHADEYELPYVLEFDGSGDYVDLPVRPRDIDEEGVTFSCRLRIEPGAGGDRMKIFSGYRSRSGDNRWDFEYHEAGGRELGFNEWGGTGSNPGNQALEEDVWYFVSFVWDADGKVTLYIDGEKDAEFDIENPTLDDGENFRIAGRPDGSEKEWEGNISDATLWQGVRTQEDIREEMNTPPSGDEEGLVGYWPMNEGEGETAYDKSDGENHGTINGAVWAIGIKPSELVAEPPEKVLPVLIGIAEEHTSINLRRQAVSSLVMLDVDLENVKSVLTDILEDTEDADEVRLAALSALLEAEVPQEEILPILLEILGNTEETDHLRLEVLEVLR